MREALAAWLRADGLEVVLLVSGGFLAARLATWVAGRYLQRLIVEDNDPPVDLARVERITYQHALTQAIRWTVLALIGFFVTLMVLDRLCVPVSMVARTLPGRQFEVARRRCQRIAVALCAAGIQTPAFVAGSVAAR